MIPESREGWAIVLDERGKARDLVTSGRGVAFIIVIGAVP